MVNRDREWDWMSDLDSDGDWTDIRTNNNNTSLIED